MLMRSNGFSALPYAHRGSGPSHHNRRFTSLVVPVAFSRQGATAVLAVTEALL
jgi:hypothetical protein